MTMGFFRCLLLLTLWLWAPVPFDGAPSAGHRALIGTANATDDDDGGPGGESFYSPAGEPPVERGDDWFSPDYEAREIVVMGASNKQLDTLRRRGYRVLNVRDLPTLDVTVARLRVPLRVSPKRAVADVRALVGAAPVDFNHVYRAERQECELSDCPPQRLIGWPGSAPCASAGILVGLIDTAVRTDHTALRGQRVEILTARSADRAPSSTSHGTALAALLVGAPGSAAPGLLPAARLIAVDAFHRDRKAGEVMDVFDFLAALEVLLARGVRVINLSFAGPHNDLVARGVQAAYRKGALLVAAAGNDGPRAEPRYPAGYDEAIAVTAVRNDLEIYRRAVQGAHIDVGAPGVEIVVADGAARGGDATRVESGTSFATAYVSAALALGLARNTHLSPAQMAHQLLASARDLGVAGVDPVFGHGLLQTQSLCDIRPSTTPR